MEIIRINNNTWRIEDEFVRFFLLVGEKEALLIDTGATAPNAKEIAQSLTKLPIWLLNTHADPDHIAGNAAFGEFFMSPNEAENYYQLHNGVGTLVPVQEGDQLDLGGRVLEIIDLPGHTKGSIAVLDRQQRMLFSGDPIQDGNIFMFGEMRCMEHYLESLDHINTYRDAFDFIYPSHGSIPVKPELIDQLKSGALQIQQGIAHGEPIEVHGNSVVRYGFPFAGFLCEK